MSNKSGEFDDQRQIELPMPPIELRRSVGVEDVSYFENEHGHLVFGEDVAPEKYGSVLDFGCGCGRIARQMILQKDNIPNKYVGLDLYRPSIDWCVANLTQIAPHFEFRHLDIFNPGLNPEGVQQVNFELIDKFSLINAHSVFTHILEDNVRFYFDQCVNSLEDDGILRSTWFLFDKSLFPMMQDFQNCLYINSDDPSNAAIYDKAFVEALYAERGLIPYKIYKPYVRGHQWLIYAVKGNAERASFPADDSDIGLARPPARQ